MVELGVEVLEGWSRAAFWRRNVVLVLVLALVAPSLGAIPLKVHAWYKSALVSSIGPKLELSKRQSLESGEYYCRD